jgi:hypothetical protein
MKMKQISRELFFTLLLFLVVSCLKAQHTLYMSIDAGYVTDRHPQLSMYAGMQTRQINFVRYFVEAGSTLQCTNYIAPDIASVNAGIQFQKGKFFTSVKTGPAYVFNRPVKDVYEIDKSTEIIFSDGADKSTCFSWLACARAGYVVADMPLYIETTYAGKLFWFGAGVKIVFGD